MLHRTVVYARQLDKQHSATPEVAVLSVVLCNSLGAPRCLRHHYHYHHHHHHDEPAAPLHSAIGRPPLIPTLGQNVDPRETVKKPKTSLDESRQRYVGPCKAILGSKPTEVSMVSNSQDRQTQHVLALPHIPTFH